MYPSLRASARSAREARPWSSTCRVLGSQCAQSPAFLCGQLAVPAQGTGRQARSGRWQLAPGETSLKSTAAGIRRIWRLRPSAEEVQPEAGRGHVFAEAEFGAGRWAGRRFPAARSRQGALGPWAEDNPATQHFQGCRTGNSLHLHEVSSGVLESRVRSGDQQSRR